MAAEQNITVALNNVIQELRIQNLTKHVRVFHGEGTQKFNNWIQDMDQLSTTCDSERMCILATLTLGGPAGTFVTRTITETPGINWQTLRQHLRTRYSELTDSFVAKERCRLMKQKTGESVQNFSERLMSAATEAFDTLNNPDVQKTLVEIFQKGVVDDHLARGLIRKQFVSLEAAVRFATDEQRAIRTFEMCRNHQIPAAEPMEVDVVRESAETKKLDEIQENVKSLTKQLERVSRQVNCHRPNQPPRRSQTVPPRYSGNTSSVPQPFNPRRPPPLCPNRPAVQLQGQYSRPVPATRPGYVPAQPRGPYPATRNDAARHRWTSDGRPVCSACGRIGHVQRLCRMGTSQTNTRGN